MNKIKPFHVLIFGSLVPAFFAYRWYSTQDPSYEPLVTLLSSVLVVIGYYFTSKHENREVVDNHTASKSNKLDIKGSVGDRNIINVGGKIKQKK